MVPPAISRSTIPAIVLLKRAWDILGILLVLLQLTSHFASDPITPGGERLSLLWVFNHSQANNSAYEDSIIGFLNVHIIVDVYFLIDVVVRLSSSTYIGQSQTLKIQPLRTTWFIIDLLLIFPHGFCWQLWKSRPALQLLSIRQGRRPIFAFFSSRDFRKKIFKLFREHSEEKKLFKSLKGLFLGGGSVIVAGRNSAVVLPISRFRWVLSFGTAAFRKTGNFIVRMASSWRKYRDLKVYSTIVRWISWMAMSIRAVYITRISGIGNLEGDEGALSAVGTSKPAD